MGCVFLKYSRRGFCHELSPYSNIAHCLEYGPRVIQEKTQPVSSIAQLGTASGKEVYLASRHVVAPAIQPGLNAPWFVEKPPLASAALLGDIPLLISA